MTEPANVSEAEADLEEAIAYFALYDTQHRLPAYLPQIARKARRGLAGGADRAEARLVLGRALIEMDSLSEAHDVLQAAVQQYPEHARLWYWLGTVTLQTGSATDAVVQLQQAVAIQPAFTEARIKLAEAHEAAGNMDSAQIAYEEVLADDPLHHPEAWNNLGFLLLQRKRLQEADSLFEQALALNPDFVVALTNLGAVRLMEQNIEAAIPLFERAVSIDPDNVAALGNLGLIHAQQGRYAQAREMLQRVIQIHPGDARAREALEQVEQLMSGS
jgi:tetratricopeptide (TPR) repeat protein